MSDETLFERLGGEPALRRIIDRFVDRIFDDTMIGFFFRNASRQRVKAKEYEFAARHLGADVPYTGKPIREAHAPHPIMGGQFMRRLRILEETLEEFDVPGVVRTHWIAHTEKLRPLVTRDAAAECNAARARERLEEAERLAERIEGPSAERPATRALPLVSARPGPEPPRSNGGT